MQPAATAQIDRLVIDEPPPTPQQGCDDFGLGELKAELLAMSGESVADMANRFHQARLAFNCAAARADSLKMQATELYPEQPAELQGPRADGVDVRVYPQPGWPHWKMAMFLRWKHQCQMIDKGFGVYSAQEDVDQIGLILDESADRAIEAQAKTIADIKDKLGVIFWRNRLEGLESKQIESLLERLRSDLSGLE